MKTPRSRFVQIIVAATLLFGGSNLALAQDAFTRDEIKEIVREYLLENPEIIFEVQQALEDKQAAELEENQVATIRQNTEALYSSPYQIEFGNPDAEITIVEFFDYNCGFCQRAMTDMQAILENNPNVKFVLKEFPLLGQPSLDAARTSIALKKLLPEKQGEFHMELLSLEGIKDGDAALRIAVEMGADEAELLEEMEKPYILDAVREVYGLAEGLGIQGTPSYVLGEKVIFGAVGYEELKREVNEYVSQQ